MLAHQALSDRIIGAAIVSEGRRKATRADLELCPAKARDQTRHRAPPLLSWIPNFLVRRLNDRNVADERAVWGRLSQLPQRRAVQWKPARGPLKRR